MYGIFASVIFTVMIAKLFTCKHLFNISILKINTVNSFVSCHKITKINLLHVLRCEDLILLSLRCTD